MRVEYSTTTPGPSHDERGWAAEDQIILLALHCALRRHSDGREVDGSSHSIPIRRIRPVRRYVPRDVLRRSWSTAPIDCSIHSEANPPEGRPGPWLAADQLGRGAGYDGFRHAADRGARRASSGRVQPGVGSTTASADAGGWIRRLMNAFGTPNAATQSRAVRMGTRLRHPIHLWRR